MTSKAWTEKIIVVTSRKKVVGERSGRVMWRNFCHSVAPSTFAAS